MTENKAKWGNTFGAHLLTAVIVSVLNQGIPYLTEKNSTETNSQDFNVQLLREQNLDMQSEMRELRERIESRDKDMLALRTRVAFLESENIRLKMEVATKTGYPKNNLRLLIDALPIAAWAKEVVMEPDEHVPGSKHKFKMIGINNEYSKTYCITDAKYRGQTDFQIHNYKLAKEYYDNDLEMFIDKKGEKVEEIVLDCQSGQYVSRVIYKYHFQLTDGTHVIGGIQVSI